MEIQNRKKIFNELCFDAYNNMINKIGELMKENMNFQSELEKLKIEFLSEISLRDKKINNLHSEVNKLHEEIYKIKNDKKSLKGL